MTGELSQPLNEAVWQMADYSYIKLYGVSTHPQETRAPTLGVQNLYLRPAACSMEHSSFHDHMHEALGFTGLLDSSSVCQCVHEMEKIFYNDLDFGVGLGGGGSGLLYAHFGVLS